MVSAWDKPLPALRPHKDLLREILWRIAGLPQVSKIILYGSYAKGTQSDDSDLDLAVFFNTAEDCLLPQYRALASICSNPVLDIQVQAFHSYELVDPCGIMEEILAHGIEFDPRDLIF